MTGLKRVETPNAAFERRAVDETAEGVQNLRDVVVLDVVSIQCTKYLFFCLPAKIVILSISLNSP